MKLVHSGNWGLSNFDMWDAFLTNTSIEGRVGRYPAFLSAGPLLECSAIHSDAHPAMAMELSSAPPK
jgi:hypothetical protein